MSLKKSTSRGRQPWFALAAAAAVLLSGCSSNDQQTGATTTAPVEATVTGDDSTTTENTIGSRQDGESTGDTTDDSTTTTPADPSPPRVVAFERGASAAVVSDSVERGARHTYTIEAGEGQTMELLITSLEDNAVFDLLDPDGDVLEREQKNTTTVLPEDGIYEVVVGGTRGNATYELTIVIPPGTSADDAESADDGPVVFEAIEFEPGTSSATLTGSIQDSAVKPYTIEVSAGQTMAFSISSIQNNAQITLVSPSGTLMMVDVTLESVPLEEDGSYTLIVSATEGQAIYELVVTVT